MLNAKQPDLGLPSDSQNLYISLAAEVDGYLRP